jgi:Glycosyl hydrolase catalytic core
MGAAAAGTAVQPMAPPARDRVGISSNTVWLPPAVGYTYLRRARDIGLGWVREGFNWNSLEPARGVYSWGRTDALMTNAARLGIRVLAVVTYAPSWASGYSGGGKYPPRDAADYARFVRIVADRYGRNGAFWRSHPRLVPAPLTAIELWNEPWLSAFWAPTPDPAAYARLVRAAATAVKTVRPGIRLLAAADAPEESAGVGKDWFASALRADPALWQSTLVDAWSVHLYCHELSPSNTTATPRARFDRLFLTRNLAHQASADKPIWVTEFGWKTAPALVDAVSEDQQAEYLHEALVKLNRDWRSIVERSFVYTWTQPRVGDAYNLVRPDGTARPAWDALRSYLATAT